MTGIEWQIAQDEQAQRVAQQAAHLLVADIQGAQAVAVHQQHLFTRQLNGMGVAEQRAARLAAEGLAEQKVAVAVHQVDARTAVGQAPQGLGNAALEGRHGIVADPHFEKITEDVQRLGLARPGVEKMQERPGDVRALLFKMQVGDQQDHSTISAFSMITSSAGTSWWPDFMVVATPLMASTTSRPSTTSPNTA